MIDYLTELASSLGRKIPVRLVKGAYWDTEIKSAQVMGLPSYPVFTQKCHTDVSFLACASKILNQNAYLYPQFGTHNAHTVVSILEMAKDKIFEFQRLFGMGEALYDYVLQKHPEVPCRIYAPIGRYKELLPYLIRRLLENGANTSFVNMLGKQNIF